VFNLERDKRGKPAWVDLAKPEEIHRLGDAHVGGRFPDVSPDGSLLLYISSETGEDEVFVTGFPSGQGKWQVSMEGGTYASWSPKGDEILFRDRTEGRTRLPAVAVTPGPEPKFGAPKPPFDWDPAWSPYYATARDGAASW